MRVQRRHYQAIGYGKGLSMKKFILRENNLEVRSCDIHLTSTGEHVTCEIVKYFDGVTKSCYTVAYWQRHKDGFDLKYVGRRPIDSCDMGEFWHLSNFGQDKLDKYFEEIDK